MPVLGWMAEIHLPKTLGVELNQMRGKSRERDDRSVRPSHPHTPFDRLEHAVAPIVHVVALEGPARPADQRIEVDALIRMESDIEDQQAREPDGQSQRCASLQP